MSGPGDVAGPNDSATPPQGGAIAWMARRPIAANLLMLILFGGGLWTAAHIQQEVFPEYTLDAVEILVAYPGASPEEVEQGLLLPIEEAVRGVPGIREISSTAMEGRAQVAIELVSGTDRMQAFGDIDQAISRIRTFPEDIETPEVRLLSDEREVMSIGLHGSVDHWTLRGLAEQLRDQLVANPAITQVSLWRPASYVTHIEIPQHRLRAHGLTLGEVARRIEASSQDVPAGAIEAHDGEVLLRMRAQKLWAEDLGRIPIVRSEAGAMLTLADLADITDGFEEVGFHGQYDQSPSVSLAVFRVGDQSPLDIADAVHATLDAFEPSLPSGVTVRIDRSAARDYAQRLSLLLENGGLAIIIVLVILALFLEYRLAFWVMAGMTVSVVGSLLFLPMIDVSINMISMFAFVVAMGIVVDDAIVIGENVYAYRERGLGHLEAAIAGARDVATPVTFTILSNVVAFVPVLFLPGTTGKFWWPLPAVVITVLLVSLVEALFILPAHIAHPPPRRRTALGRLLRRVQQGVLGVFTGLVNRLYRPFLGACLRQRYITLSAALTMLMVVGGYAASDHIGMVMMPQVAADEIEAGVRLPVGTTPDQAARVAEAVTASTRRMFDEHDLHEVARGIKTNVRRGNFIDVEIVMRPPDERDMTAAEVIALWRDEIGDLEGVDQVTFEAERGPGGWRDDIEVDLSHSDVEVLARASQAFKAELERFESTRDVNDSYRKGKARLDFELTAEGHRLGFTAESLGQQLRDAFFGALARRQLRGTNEVELRVKLPEVERKRMASLEQLVVRSPSGVEVPLSEVARVTSTEAFSSISRRDGRRVVTVGADVEPQRDTTRVLRVLREEVLPALRADYPGITWSFQGTQAEMRASTETLWGGFALAMLVIYALLAVAFGSYTQPIVVMSAIPFGIVGAVFGHMLLGFDLSLISLMGVIALSGVVVNDALIMVDHANKRRQEMPAIRAIHEAGVRRFRPIILTTLTTFGGLTPILMERSLQAQHLIPMAISLGFGIVFATAIILVIVPCLYMVLEDVLGVAAGSGSEGGRAVELQPEGGAG
jgi:multidrug efflux pump subunit AcrB